MNNDKISVLLVENKMPAFQACKRKLGEGFEVNQARNPRQVDGVINKMKDSGRSPMLFIVSLCILASPQEGIEVIKHIRKIHQTTPIVVWSRHLTDYGEKAKQAAGRIKVVLVRKYINDLAEAANSILE